MTRTAGPRDFDPFSPSFVTNPYPQLASLRREGTVHHVRQPNGIERYLVVRHEEGRGVLTDRRLSADPAYGRAALERAGYLKPGDSSGLVASLLTTDPPVHTRLRRLLASSFDMGLDYLEPVVARQAAELLTAMEQAGSPVDLVSRFAHPLTIATLREILGINEDASASFTRWISDVLTPRHRPNADAIRQAADKAIRAYLSSLITAKAADDGGDDLTARMIARWREDPARVSEVELSNMLYELILAGYLTTAGLIVNGVLALLDDPAQLELFRADPAVRASGVDELLRFDGPAFSSSVRFATQDITVAGTLIPQGAMVAVSFAAANRDERAFPGADKLDLSRPNSGTHLGFSHGIHLCWGAPIARMEARVAIGALVERFGALRLAVDRSAVQWGAVGNSRSPACLPVSADD